MLKFTKVSLPTLLIIIFLVGLIACFVDSVAGSSGAGNPVTMQ